MVGQVLHPVEVQLVTDIFHIHNLALDLIQQLSKMNGKMSKPQTVLQFLLLEIMAIILKLEQ